MDLSYCDLSRVDWTNFTMWSIKAYESKLQGLKTKFDKVEVVEITNADGNLKIAQNLLFYSTSRR